MLELMFSQNMSLLLQTAVNNYNLQLLPCILEKPCAAFTVATRNCLANKRYCDRNLMLKEIIDEVFNMHSTWDPVKRGM